MQTPLLAVILVLLTGVAAVAGTVFPQAPDSYTPGEPFEVAIAVPGMADLASYSLDLLVESADGQAGVDFGIESARVATDGYVFPSSDNYFASINVDSPSTHRLTISDFVFANTEISEANNRLAIAKVFTDADHTGSLQLSISAETLELRSVGFPGVDVPFFDSLRDQIAQDRVEIAAVPEPTLSTLVLICLGLTSAGRLTARTTGVC